MHFRTAIYQSSMFGHIVVKLIDWLFVPRKFLSFLYQKKCNETPNSVDNDLELGFVCMFQVIWCPGPCITSNHYTSRTPATGHRSTRRPAPPFTGNPKPSIPFVTLCTARRWSGRTPTWSRPKSPYKLRGELQSSQKIRRKEEDLNVSLERFI